MECLHQKQLQGIESLAEWEELQDRYRHHCTLCDRLLDKYAPLIQRKIENLQAFEAELEEEPGDQPPLEPTARQALILEYIPLLWQAVRNSAPDLEAWQICQRVCQAMTSSDTLQYSRRELIEALWENLWREIDQKATQGHTGDSLPENWQATIRNILRGSAAPIYQLPTESVTPAVIYYPRELMLAAADDDIEQWHEAQMQRLAKWENPLWQYRDPKLQIAVIYDRGRFYSEVYAGPGVQVHLKVIRSDQTLQEWHAQVYVMACLGDEFSLLQGMVMEIYLDGELYFREKLPSFQPQQER